MLDILFNYGLFILPISLLGIFSFGKVFGSKDNENFVLWAKEVSKILDEGKNCIDSLKNLNSKDSATLEEFKILENRFTTLNPIKFKEDFSLKGKEKQEFEKLLSELDVFIEDYDFFLNEIRLKRGKIEEIERLNKQIDNFLSLIADSESKQQLLARTIPRLSNTGELEMVEVELNELKKLVPEKLEVNNTVPEDLRVRIDRTNLKLGEWFKKLEFIENSISKYRGRIKNSVREEEHKQKLTKVHSWLDSAESKMLKLNEKIKKIAEVTSNESTPSKELLNSLKDLEKITVEIEDLKPPGIDIEGEKQTKISIDFRLKELNKLNESINQIQERIVEYVSYRISFLRSSILEKMFLKSHQLSFTKVNYSLGYKNELLLQGWLQQTGSEYPLTNFQNKYLMLNKQPNDSFKDISTKIFQALKDLTEFEKKTNEVSYNASMKWLIANDDKWLAK